VTGIRRVDAPGAFVFITQVVHDRRPAFADPAMAELLRTTVRAVRGIHPFAMFAYVFLPDHFHLLIRPLEDSTTSAIMHSLKLNFLRNWRSMPGVDPPGRFWQKRYWDHVIRDESDHQRHLDYIHYNPVKHGLASRPEDWPHSSFSEWVARGRYEAGWGWTEPTGLRGETGVKGEPMRGIGVS
jgi:putative transposase